jgi:hypothetical protein
MNELLLVPAPFGVWGKRCLSGKVSPGPLREAKNGKTPPSARSNLQRWPEDWSEWYNAHETRETYI